MNSADPVGGAVEEVLLHALADDLSGAAEVAALLTTRNRAAALVLSGAPVGPVAVTDLDARHLTGAEVSARARAAVALAPRARVLVKLDSLLRGPLPELVGAVGPVVVATALPALGRVVRGGAVLVDGRPLGESAAWATEGARAPAGVPEALEPLVTRVVPVDVVRSDGLREVLAALVADGVVPVCDAETDEDLDAVVAATPDRVALAGSGGIAAAVGRWLRSVEGCGAAGPEGETAGGAARLRGTRSHPLIVVGSAEPAADAQVRALVATGVTERLLHPADLATGAIYPDPLTGDTRFGEIQPGDERAGDTRAGGGADVDAVEPGSVATAGDSAAPGAPLGAVTRGSTPEAGGSEAEGSAVDGTSPLDALRVAVAEALRLGPVVLRPARDAPVDPARSRALSVALARVAADAVRGTTTPLALTGGETARRVLDALGVRSLRPLGSVHHGAVLALADDERLVVTRPGSFGGPDSLIRIAAALSGGANHPTEGTTPMSSTATTPLIAVTMGDGAGVGPEVVVGALVEPRDDCRPVVVGDAARLRAAAEVLGLDADVVAVEKVSDAEFTPGRINVIDLGLLPADLPWGRLSEVAGNASYEYIRVAAELAMKGEVQGICTAPLNKEALHAAGHRYPGHTELLAHFCGVPEVSMMLSTPKVRVIHVTTHIGLIDAVNRIEPGLVERTVRRGHEALERAGVPNPRIAVCGINPHAGENGLFGYGEEEEKIAPAIEALRAAGIDARGPVPADTAFFVAGRGDYDLVVAMYHDQGHGPVKVLGIEAGVNITVGLPVIRTSVDHGTAFDIAGTGKVDVRSMIEALRQAAQMSPSPAAATS
ncbi:MULTISPECIES: 4-hydroxythreonine-4-phosphate dehydrogenase PdxA [Actinosynnema]|uniref:4-hydroxythreonine-4-phosphate dehydrogenase PdxA n=1 Tax=Actinosynnema TaxID=40566 RepID=UPI0020A4DB1C|nr:4-hydroxythreonine-4-phosphate dehydrogenase PdxA [Actinosynnema pretiosum]MCP2092495.1 4-hydroxythreonine-4-phosphate dehydrogenase (EC 1.1.1.262) [Actinosynnema pretiosum]